MKKECSDIGKESAIAALQFQANRVLLFEDVNQKGNLIFHILNDIKKQN
jgi:hypothetical protein